MDYAVRMQTMVRNSTGDIDYLPTTEEVDGVVKPLKIRSLMDVSDTELIGQPDYIQDVDYMTTIDFDSGRMAVVWLAGGKHPSNGATYYVTYIKAENVLETSFLRTL